MTEHSERLQRLALEYCEKLSGHEVLGAHWPALSLVLKGSAARGNADELSDIDFVFYTDAETRRRVIGAFREKGLSDRPDGLFVPLPDWIGHYHVASFDDLRGCFERREYADAWECANVSVLHDPDGRYAGIVGEGMGALFGRVLEDVRAEYLNLQLTLDWMTHPLMRGDEVAVLLHCAKFIRGFCRLCYLLDRKAYPHDKWIFHYLGDTRLGRQCGEAVRNLTRASASPAGPGRELAEYPQFTMGVDLTRAAGQRIGEEFGPQPWLQEWYLYV